MSKFNKDAAEMIGLQLKNRGISDKKLLQAFLKVPRQAFVPPDLAGEAYEDHPLPIGEGQTISQPFMVAVMSELLSIEGSDRILEIGTGSGYQTAILAELGKDIYTVERILSLSETARSVLKNLGYSNIHFKVGDGTLGWPEQAPFDKIIVTAAVKIIPDAFIEQLGNNGRLVIPVGERFSQELILVEKNNGNPVFKNYGGCVFVPLVGGYSTE